MLVLQLQSKKAKNWKTPEAYVKDYFGQSQKSQLLAF